MAIIRSVAANRRLLLRRRRRRGRRGRVNVCALLPRRREATTPYHYRRYRSSSSSSSPPPRCYYYFLLLFNVFLFRFEFFSLVQFNPSFTRIPPNRNIFLFGLTLRACMHTLYIHAYGLLNLTNRIIV